MPAIWPWVLCPGGSTDLGTRRRVAPGHAYACPQPRGLSLLRCVPSRAGSALGMRAGFACLGRMGQPVCANLVWAGYVVTAGRARSA